MKLLPLITTGLLLAPVQDAGAQSNARMPSAKEREARVRVQVFLDSALFGPGKVDGLPGEFTTKAILNYQKAHSLEATGLPENLPIPEDAPAYTEYTIKPDDRKFVGNLPSKPIEQARLNYLPYDSIAEFLSERFHCSLGLLEHLNPSLNLEKLKVGDSLRVPAVEPFQIEDIRSLAQLPEKPEFKGRRIHISRKERQLELVEGENLLASVPITPGSDTLPTPPGKWRIYGITTMPSFRWDEGVLNHGVRTDQFFMLPPGPNNPVGVVWCALNRPGIGIHGTNQPETIGRAFSHGCMRVANWDVIRLVQKVTAGIPVVIE
jgi:lipoprotein-anchoring transpeptidase ErfK/SrfK